MKLLPAKGIRRGLHANKTAKTVAKDLISVKKVSMENGIDISHDLMGVHCMIVSLSHSHGILKELHSEGKCGIRAFNTSVR